MTQEILTYIILAATAGYVLWRIIWRATGKGTKRDAANCDGCALKATCNKATCTKDHSGNCTCH